MENGQALIGSIRFQYKKLVFWAELYDTASMEAPTTVGSNSEHSSVQIKRKASEILRFQKLLVEISGIEPLTS